MPLILALAGACGGPGGRPAGSSPPAGAEAPTTVRLGYLPNLTHATAIVGVEQGIFRKALGDDELELSSFNAGPVAVQALFSGALDAAYIGPNPTINAWAKSHGRAVRIVSGATSGGAALVVKPAINGAADLRGKRLASPQLGGTQDVALRHWLLQAGLRTDPQGGGDVSVLPQDNPQTLETFRGGQIDGAWVPEPWATRLVEEGGGKILVDERTLWPEGRFVTTQLVVRTEFLRRHPGAVRKLVAGQVRADEFVNAHPAEAQRLVNQGITRLTGKGLPEGVVRGAWARMQFTNDPVASSLVQSARHAEAVGLLDRVDLEGIYDLSMLNQVLRGAGQPEVRS